MSNYADLIKDTKGMSSEGITIAGDVLGTLADFSGAFGFVQLGIGLITSLFSSDTELQQVLAQIQKDFKELKSFIAAEDKLSRMRDNDLGMKDAVAVFEQLPANLNIISSLEPGFIQTQIQTCIAAALFFAENDDKWQAVWGSVPYYSDEWSGQVAPDDPSDGLVFNHTYTLPQFLRSIYILLTTIGALSPKSLPDYRDVLGRCLTRLSNVHDTIVSSGIVGTRVPAQAAPDGSLIFEVGGPVNGPPLSPGDSSGPVVGWDTSWRTGSGLNWPYGAVERYSGASLVAEYNPGGSCGNIDLNYTYFPSVPSPVPHGSSYNFIRVLQLRIEQQKKALYIQLGLPKVRQVINQLRSMTGQPPLAAARYEDSSLRQAFDIMKVPLPAGIRSLRSAFQETPPFGSWCQVCIDPETHTLPVDPDTGNYTETWVPGLPLPDRLRGLRGLLAANG